MDCMVFHSITAGVVFIFSNHRDIPTSLTSIKSSSDRRQAEDILTWKYV